MCAMINYGNYYNDNNLMGEDYSIRYTFKAK